MPRDTFGISLRVSYLSGKCLCFCCTQKLRVKRTGIPCDRLDFSTGALPRRSDNTWRDDGAEFRLYFDVKLARRRNDETHVSNATLSLYKKAYTGACAYAFTHAASAETRKRERCATSLTPKEQHWRSPSDFVKDFVYVRSYVSPQDIGIPKAHTDNLDA